MNFYKINGELYNLLDLSSHTLVGVITGTFDPIHRVHLEVADNALNEGCDLVLFYPHSLNLKKSPLPLQYRTSIIEGVLYGNSRMGLLIPDEVRRKEWEVAHGFDTSSKSCLPLFKYLHETTSATYLRILGSDKLDGAVGDEEFFFHLVNRRNRGLSVNLPKGFMALPLASSDLSSSSLTLGDLNGRIYTPVRKSIELYLPRITKKS